MERYPDIEIYLAKADHEGLNAWLNATLGAAPLKPAGKHKWRTYGQWDGARIAVLLVDNAADGFAMQSADQVLFDGFASLWFDSDATPWPRDTDCARDAAYALGCEVRCSLGGWQPGDDPDRFWQVFPDGREGAIDWPDSGQ